MQEVIHPDFVSFEVAGREHLQKKQSALETIETEMSLSGFVYGPATASFGMRSFRNTRVCRLTL
jgi:hypothetical protein